MKSLLFFMATLISLTVNAQFDSPTEVVNYKVESHHRDISKETVEVTDCSVEYYGYFYSVDTGKNFCEYKGNYVVVEVIEKESWLTDRGTIFPGSYKTTKVAISTPISENLVIHDNGGRKANCHNDEARRLCENRQQRYKALIGKLK